MKNKYGTDETILQGVTGTIQSDDGSPLLSTSSDGADSYVLGASLSAGIYSGVQNGNFGSPTQNIGTANPISSDNSLPYFGFTDSSSGRITAALVEDSSQSTGYAVQFTITGGSVGDSAYLERIVSIAGSRSQAISYQARASWVGATSATTYRGFIEGIYLTNDGTTTTGSASTASATGSSIASVSPNALDIVARPNAAGGVVTTDAAFLRIRAGVTVGTATTSATVKLAEIKLASGSTELRFVDESVPYQYAPRIVSSSGLTLEGNAAGTSGANPRIQVIASLGQIIIDASNNSITGGTPTNGDIFLAHSLSGKVYFGGSAGAAYGDTNLYRTGANALRTDDVYIVGSRVTPNANTIDQPGHYFEPTAGYYWGDRDVSATTDANLFLSSGFVSGNLQVIRFFRKITSGGTAYSATGHVLIANNTTTAPSFAAGSDYRLKTDIRSADEEIDFVEKIDALRPVLFTNRESGDENLLGFIAHEVVPHIPEAVEGEKDAVDDEGNPVYQSLAAAKMIPYLVGAVKALSARVKELEEKG